MSCLWCVACLRVIVLMMKSHISEDFRVRGVMIWLFVRHYKYVTLSHMAIKHQEAYELLLKAHHQNDYIVK